MGTVRQPGPVKIFVGVLASDLGLLPEARAGLEAELGPVDLVSAVLDFDYTRYYEPEMGPGLKRQFWGFARLAAPDRLPQIKLLTNALEESLAVGGRRRVNLDPGYLSLAKVVLATTKDFSHRLYLGQGIYGEITLMFRRGDPPFTTLPWTYPDFRSAAYQRFFVELRSLYRRQISSVRGPES